MSRVATLALTLLSLALLGCKPTTAPAPVVSAAETKPEPGVIEIKDVVTKVSDENLAQFRINYEFTSGKPSKFYMCSILFAGSPKSGQKPLDSWEMKPSGTVIANVELGDAKVNEFTVQFSEADSPDRGYKENSNVFSGKLFPDAKPAEAASK